MRSIFLKTEIVKTKREYFIDTITDIINDQRNLKALRDMPDIINFNGC